MISSDANKPLAWALGLGGLIPFFALAWLSWKPLTLAWLPGFSAQAALAHYGAGILSFVGALHWGLAIAASEKSTARLLWSVVPCLFAVVVLQFSKELACMGLAIGLLVAWAIDFALYAGKPFAAWFMVLRSALSLGAATALIVGALAP